MHVERWKARFREYMELRNWSLRTADTYCRALGPFFDFLVAQGVESLGEITRALVEAYRVELYYTVNRGPDRSRQGQSLTLRTQASRLSAVKAFLRFLHRQGYLLVDPGASVEQPKLPSLLPLILSEDEVLRLLEGVDTALPLGLRDRAILELLYGTALRNSELTHLKLSRVDRVRGELRVFEGKNRKSRVVPLGEEALFWLGRYLDESRPQLVEGPDPEWVFVSFRGRQLLPPTVGRVVQQAGVRAGLEKRVFPHLLRHCCATHMLARGAGIRQLQTLLGHATLAATQIYTRVEVTDLRQVLMRCHPRERGQ